MKKTFVAGALSYESAPFIAQRIEEMFAAKLFAIGIAHTNTDFNRVRLHVNCFLQNDWKSPNENGFCKLEERDDFVDLSFTADDYHWRFISKLKRGKTHRGFQVDSSPHFSFGSEELRITRPSEGMGRNSLFKMTMKICGDLPYDPDEYPEHYLRKNYEVAGLPIPNTGE